VFLLILNLLNFLYSRFFFNFNKFILEFNFLKFFIMKVYSKDLFESFF